MTIKPLKRILYPELYWNPYGQWAEGHASDDPQASLSLGSPLHDKEDDDPLVPGTQTLDRVLVPPELPHVILQ